jgi:hypothetical protein
VVALAFALGLFAGAGFSLLLAIVRQNLWGISVGDAFAQSGRSPTATSPTPPQLAANGRPVLSPLPAAQEFWSCEVVVIGGTLGGVAAAAHAMQSGATTCLIELTPWLGGQISSQGVSALDESHAMTSRESFSPSWLAFKRLIRQQTVTLPDWVRLPSRQRVADLNSCWVGQLCFLPRAGAAAAEQLLKGAIAQAPASKWGTSIAFKGAEFNATGKEITAVYGVRRIPRDAGYVPQGRLSKELASWYSWNSDPVFEKVPLKLQAPAGKRMQVVDATDTGELVGWANIPHRLGADSQLTTGEINASKVTNPGCTQAFTFPFVLAIHDDRGNSKKQLAQVKSDYSRKEHRQIYDMEGFPMFSGQSFFNYRRILSTIPSDPFVSTPATGDMTVVNWNRGNDWGVMNPPLILTTRQIDAAGQRQNWLGGMSVTALRQAETHALLFAEWLLEKQAKPDVPLAFLSGAEMPMATESGLSMVPYIREGRRILGPPAHRQRAFMLREADLRNDMSGGRDFSKTAIALIHYAVDIHGCRNRNWEPSWEAGSAPNQESKVRLTQLPLESLIPQGVDNLLIGGKSLAVTHIANAVTRIHYSEWSIGAAAGATAGWMVKQAQPGIKPAEIISKGKMSPLQQYLTQQGLRFTE